MDHFWNHRLALITGASSGIGAAIASKFSKEGIHVILVARHEDKLVDLASQIQTAGGIASYYVCDLTKSDARVSLVTQIKHEVGIPDILVNNAGIGWYGYFSKMPWEIAENIISLNIEAPTHLTSLFLADMLKLDKARIINIGSIIGKLPEQGVALYSSSKSYLDSFSTSVFRELRGTQTTMSVLRAGPVKTNFFDNAAEYTNGGRIPAESLAISADKVANAAWSLVIHPRRFVYVPFYTVVSPLLETFFSWLLDIVGPILLKHSSKPN